MNSLGALINLSEYQPKAYPRYADDDLPGKQRFGLRCRDQVADTVCVAAAVKCTAVRYDSLTTTPQVRMLPLTPGVIGGRLCTHEKTDIVTCKSGSGDRHLVTAAPLGKERVAGRAIYCNR